jgi:hypothetical protein
VRFVSCGKALILLSIRYWRLVWGWWLSQSGTGPPTAPLAISPVSLYEDLPGFLEPYGSYKHVEYIFICPICILLLSVVSSFPLWSLEVFCRSFHKFNYSNRICSPVF